MIYARISGTGGYLPSRVVSNDDLVKTLDTSDEWIRSRTGIKQRHFANGQSAADLAEKASQQALQSAKLLATELDLIIVATTTPDHIFPATAILVQNRLGAKCPAFDVQAVCAGFIYALTTAQQYIKSGFMKNILVVGSEVLSTIIDQTDRSTAVLFGDGAGAVVLSADKQTGILHADLKADGHYWDALYVDKNSHFIRMKGNEVFKIAVNKLSDLALETLQAAQLAPSELDWMVPHQANIRIIQAVAKRINHPMDKVIVTIDKHANTSAASIPLALDVAVKDGRIQKGQTCLLEGIGGGFAWGSILLRY